MKKDSHFSLQTYLTSLGAFTALASTSNAAVISIDVSAFTGPNGGVASGKTASMPLFTPEGLQQAEITIYNGFEGGIGLAGNTTSNGVYQTVSGIGMTSTAKASPQRFAAGETVSGNDFISHPRTTLFYVDYNNTLYTAPSWGEGSFLGFWVNGVKPIDQGSEITVTYYGWLEVTWDQDLKEFYILSGAYESTPGMAIVTPIPEASSLAMLVAGAAGVAALRRRKKAA